MKQHKPDKYLSEELIRGLQFFFTIGVTVVFSIVIPTGIGWWLDHPEQLNTKPLYTLIGFTLGTLLALYSLLKLLHQFQESQKKRTDEESEQ